MNEKTRQFVARRFKAYYRSVRITPPKEIEMREWGFVLFDPSYPAKLVMRRHTSFATRDDLATYLRENAPAHAYHSAAVYKYPTEAMAKKGWLGADLIFDLDADHIVDEAELPRYSYEDLLELVKVETLKLIDFLTTDFGFADDDIQLAFSGSRGYHVHINTGGVRGLGSRERREIVDYVSATGLEILIGMGRTADNAFREWKRCPRCNKTTSRTICPICKEATERIPVKAGKGGRDIRLSSSRGWGRRLRKGLSEFFITEISEKSEEAGIKKLVEMGITEKTAKEIINMTKEEGMARRIERIAEGQLGFFPLEVWDKIIETEKVKSADRVDEPVTADIKRLIRLPGSLHGKSSLRVKPLTVESFRKFNPLVDAVVFGDKPVEIRATRNSSIKLKGEQYKVAEGEIAQLPEYVALYFLCRDAAELT